LNQVTLYSSGTLWSLPEKSEYLLLIAAAAAVGCELGQSPNRLVVK